MNSLDWLWTLAVPPLAWLGLRWFERANLYFPKRQMDSDPGLIGLGFEDLRLAAEDGTALHAWFVPLEADSPVILFCHGNGGNISFRLDKLLRLRQAGASVLLFDYRGYGRSAGRPSEQGTYQDAQAAYRWLTETRGLPARRIVIHGESLGGAVAMELAGRCPSAGLILESTFTSVIELGRQIFPFLPLNMMIRFRYDTLSKISRLDRPLLVMHSPEDDMIPYGMGQKLFA
ncbi:MAG: alpha/beta hydrolase, partial [Elusimicrobiota bacterium]